MESRQFLYNTPMDVAIRNVGIWPYFGAYGLVFLFAFAMALPAPFHLPLVADHERTSGASVWAFLVAYPLFHVLMKPRALQRFGTPLGQFAGVVLGAIVVGPIAYLLHFQMPDDPVSRVGRALAHPVNAAAFMVAASSSVSLGCFLVIEPLRSRSVDGLRKALGSSARRTGR